MLREWVGNGYVTRDHSNLAHEVTFPIVTAAPEATETVAADVSPDQGTGQTRAPEAATDAAVSGSAGGAEQRVEPVEPKDIQQARPAPASQSAAFQDELEKLKSLLKRTFEWLKKNF